MSDAVADYIVALADCTRSHSQLVMGASPRASRGLYRAAKVWAAMEGRDFVTPDDVKALAHPVLEHRLVLSSGARFSGASAAAVLDDVLSRVEALPAPEGEPAMRISPPFAAPACWCPSRPWASLLLGGVLAAFFRPGRLAFALMFVFLLAGASRLWAVLAARKVTVSRRRGGAGAVPGGGGRLELTVRNDKFLPLVWLELFFPLSRNLCLTPEESRKPDDWEALLWRRARLHPAGGGEAVLLPAVV